MDKKILYIGLASLFLILLSTLALIVLVFKPNFFPLPDNKVDSLKNKGGLVNPLLIDSSKVNLDSLNYSINSLVIKRENLLLIDSAYKLNGAVNYYRKIIDSLQAEVKKVGDSNSIINTRYLESLKKQSVQVIRVEEKTQSLFSEQDKKGFSKIYENMSPEIAAKQIEEMTDVEAAKVLLSIDSKQSAKILDKMEPKKAAKIWNALNSKGKK
jgi:hypothetical protein